MSIQIEDWEKFNFSTKPVLLGKDARGYDNGVCRKEIIDAIEDSVIIMVAFATGTFPE